MFAKLAVKIHEATFVISVAKWEQLPQSLLPEVAFAGRSNAGKSTLINSVVQRRALAIASKTPGRTQLLNFFLLRFRAGEAARNADAVDGDVPDPVVSELMCHLVDLPGYGFAKVAKGKRRDWSGVLSSYMHDRPNLSLLILAQDIRRDLEEEEHWFLEQLNSAASSKREVILALTKSDKLGSNELRKRIKLISEQSGLSEDRLFACGLDARGKQGVEKLRVAIFEMLTGMSLSGLTIDS